MPADECTRRGFFTHFGVSAIESATRSARRIRGVLSGVSEKPQQPPVRTWLRPPGALSEKAFQKACTRCDACVKACPYMSIRKLGPEFGEAAGTPAIIPTESPCYLCEGMPCIESCEPGALVPTSVSDVSMGLAVIERSGCYVEQGQPCDYCMTRCPLGSKAIVPGDRGVPSIVEAGCTGCGVCAYICPADTIQIVPQIPAGPRAVLGAS